MAPPPIPADVLICFADLVDFPAKLELDRKEAADLIMKLRDSELEKKLCGDRLIALIQAEGATK